MILKKIIKIIESYQNQDIKIPKTPYFEELEERILLSADLAPIEIDTSTAVELSPQINLIAEQQIVQNIESFQHTKKAYFPGYHLEIC